MARLGLTGPMSHGAMSDKEAAASDGGSRYRLGYRYGWSVLLPWCWVTLNIVKRGIDACGR